MVVSLVLIIRLGIATVTPPNLLQLSLVMSKIFSSYLNIYILTHT